MRTICSARGDGGANGPAPDAESRSANVTLGRLDSTVTTSFTTVSVSSHPRPPPFSRCFKAARRASNHPETGRWPALPSSAKTFLNQERFAPESALFVRSGAQKLEFCLPKYRCEALEQPESRFVVSSRFVFVSKAVTRFFF